MKVNYVLLYGTPYLKHKVFGTFEDISKFLINKNIVNYSIFKKLEDKEEIEMIYRDNDIRVLEDRINKAIEYHDNCVDNSLALDKIDNDEKLAYQVAYEIHKNYLDILRGEDNATHQASSIKEAVEQDIRKKSMIDVSMNPDFFNKSYDEMRKVVCVGSKASLQAIKDGNKEFKFTVDGTEYTAKVKNKDNNSFEIIGVKK